MKNYVHARLGHEEGRILRELIKATGETVSSLVKKGLRLVYEKETYKRRNALEVAGDLAGSVMSGIGDLSTNKKHLEDFGKK